MVGSLLLCSFNQLMGLHFSRHWLDAQVSDKRLERCIPHNCRNRYELLQSKETTRSQLSGWVSMVTGQSVVLYSRLHLVVRNRRILRPVLIMIITNAICMHGPTILFTIASNSIDDPHWNTRLGIMERIQLPIFCVQESIISIIYIVSTIRLLASTSHTKTRKVMRLLVTINAACVSMDAILIGLEYSNGYATETSIKALLYAIKLKLEFAVLNQLMNLAHHGFTEGSRWGLPERESSARRSYEPPPVKDTATEIDTERYKTSNLTGWPRGRLFNNPLVKRPSVPNEHTINSPISQKEGLQVIYELEASKDASTSRPHPPMIPKQHFPSGYLSMSGRDKKEPDAIWSLRED